MHVQYTVVPHCVNVHWQVGLPPWIVEARHAAAHGLLPPMSTFRACMDFGLQWMKVRYWDVVMQKMEEKGKDNVPREGEEGRVRLDNGGPYSYSYSAQAINLVCCCHCTAQLFHSGNFVIVQDFAD